MLRWASGNDGVVSVRRHPLTGTSPASGDSTASDLDTRSPTTLTMVNFTYKLDLTCAAVNRTLPASAVLSCKRSNRGLSSRAKARRIDTRFRPRVEASFPVIPWKWKLRRTTMNEQQSPPTPGQVQIKADEKDLQGMYSNLVMIHHHAEEFTLNFVYVFPNGTQGKLLSSMIVSPGHAKRIWRALGENLTRFEAQYGPIKEG